MQPAVQHGTPAHRLVRPITPTQACVRCRPSALAGPDAPERTRDRGRLRARVARPSATACAIGAAFPRRATNAVVSIVIVGGGIAGLSAAWRLQKLGCDRPRAARDGSRGRRQRAIGRERGVGVSVGRALRAGAGPACHARARAVRGARASVADGTWQERRSARPRRKGCSSTAAGRRASSHELDPPARDRDQMSRFEARIDALRASGDPRFPAPSG